jgi:hypothetical protein
MNLSTKYQPHINIIRWEPTWINHDPNNLHDFHVPAPFLPSLWVRISSCASSAQRGRPGRPGRPLPKGVEDLARGQAAKPIRSCAMSSPRPFAVRILSTSWTLNLLLFHHQFSSAFAGMASVATFRSVPAGQAALLIMGHSILQPMPITGGPCCWIQGRWNSS